jgi:hypothetical protein
MAKLEDIDTSKPFAFFETKLETTLYRVLDDTQLILNNEDRDIFYHLIRNNEELRQLIEDTGHFQGGHEDEHGNPEIAALFSRKQLYEALIPVDSPVKEKIVMALSKWDNDFVTFNVCRMVVPEEIN